MAPNVATKQNDAEVLERGMKTPPDRRPRRPDHAVRQAEGDERVHGQGVEGFGLPRQGHGAARPRAVGGAWSWLTARRLDKGQPLTGASDGARTGRPRHHQRLARPSTARPSVPEADPAHARAKEPRW